MRDRDLYATILGITKPWEVLSVELIPADKTVEVMVAYRTDAGVPCPECGQAGPRYDAKPRRWRHLDTMQYRTILVAEVPRVNCDKHGVHQTKVPWAEAGSRFTALFECLVIDWLLESSLTAVARLIHISWDEADGIRTRAVNRGLARRKLDPPRQIGVDETSFQKRHEYVTVVCDLQRDRVLHVADDRKRESFEGFLDELPDAMRNGIEVVAMDMWPPFIRATVNKLKNARIVFDKFHIAKHLGDAVDRVRRQEHRELLAEGDTRLVGSKYLWLQNRENMKPANRLKFAALKATSLKVARAWGLKEAAMTLWHFTSTTWATKAWKKWLAWAGRSQLDPVKKVARMISAHLTGVVNGAALGVTNALAEGINSRIQWIKHTARGFRNRKRFRMAIYFHLGGLDLYPSSAQATHTKA